jgi:predicted transcriptional regulator of viral defense system
MHTCIYTGVLFTPDQQSTPHSSATRPSPHEQTLALATHHDEIIDAIRRSERAVFTEHQLGALLPPHPDLSLVPVRRAVTFLRRSGVVKAIELRSAEDRMVTRYAREGATPFNVALSLVENGYLSHETALYLNRIVEAPSRTIYVNQEQSAKPMSRMPLTQPAIDRAFRAPQRKSKREFTYREHRMVVLNGKQTGGLGTGELVGDQGERLPATLLARTLVDVVVRPDYAGGPVQILEAYRRATQRISVDDVVSVLQRLDYVYPYHQSVGFYLEQVGVPRERLKPLEALGLSFDFYLGYGMADPTYDPRWRVFVPRGLVTGLPIPRP